MKKYKFTQEQKMLHHLILHSHDVPTAWGLFDGMTGIMLVLVHYARIHKMPVIEYVSDYLMEQITSNLTKTDSIYLGHGMAGIGWGIEYLIQNGYMKGCSAELMREIDERIMGADMRRMADDSVEKGFVGLFHYVIAHLQGATLQGQSVFDRQYLDDWMQLLLHRHESFPQDKRWGLMSEMLAKTIDGQCLYTLDLLPFVKPMKRAPFDLLGLHNGLAGYMELQLHNNRSI
ncbi:hypothetical protein QUW17_02125 [Bacteroides gallinaceum]|mgnify:CR=1 FL=1|uniref:hypothetical protein n=1 Tax=Bacteroides gallinaceum TaxID=1462571 RepID=UPI0025A46C7D|nr:hypothetical protein [Bacteroides gallinaceum]MDM8206684.1 hypothetical protein [Bacteroides gallinaceum]